MKIDIVDLLDNYCDHSVELDIPAELAKENCDFVSTQPKVHHGKRPLLVAAALLLVVTVAAVVPFTLSRTIGDGAMTEGTVPTESVKKELPTELPATVPGSSP